MVEIRWTVGATDDLREVVQFIAQDSAAYAAAVASRILHSVDRLQAHPRLGRVVPEYRDSAIRELIVGSYRVVYRVDDRRVGVIAVVHGSRSLLRQLGDRPWSS